MGEQWLSTPPNVAVGLPWQLRGKEPACQCRRHKRHGFTPWVGKIPWRRDWQPTPVFLPVRGIHGQRSLAGYSPRGRKESGMTLWLNTNKKRCCKLLGRWVWEPVFLGLHGPLNVVWSGGHSGPGGTLGMKILQQNHRSRRIHSYDLGPS